MRVLRSRKLSNNRAVKVDYNHAVIDRENGFQPMDFLNFGKNNGLILASAKIMARTTEEKNLT
jgi:hypothetical protein